MQPFVLTSPSQVRPPPVLKGELWAKDYNEIKDLGGAHHTSWDRQQRSDPQGKSR